tara:strand:+ start:260 stop:682 length:423 start_codon:yes stop_codon:yes gene_type:complete
LNKILVTGSAGFIGFHLVKRLLEENRLVYGIDNINDYYNQDLKMSRLEILKKSKEFRFKKIDIEDRLSIKANINFVPMQKGDVKETFADIDHSKKYLQYKPKTSLSDGLEKFINWYIKYNKVNFLDIKYLPHQYFFAYLV